MRSSPATLQASDFRRQGRAGVLATVDEREKERLRNKAHISFAVLQAADFFVSVGLGALLLVVEPYFFITVALVVAWFAGRTVIAFFFVRDVDTMIEISVTNVEPFSYTNIFRPISGHVVSVFELAWYISGGVLVAITLYWASTLSDDSTALILHSLYVGFAIVWKMAHHIAIRLIFRAFAHAAATPQQC